MQTLDTKRPGTVHHESCRAPHGARGTGVHPWSRLLLFSLLLAWVGVGSSGCSIKKLAVNKLGDALAAGGSTFSGDDDPDLVKEAAPFSLKTMEALLAESPKHVELRRAAAAGFTQYAFAFVQMEADERESADFSASEALRQRARRLYLRGRNHALRGLEVRYPHFESILRTNPAVAVARLTLRDVPLAYWAGASWAAAIAQSKDQPDLIGELPLVEALMDRSLALDSHWGKGSLHSFFIAYEPLRPGAAAAAYSERSKAHLDQAVQLSHGNLAGPYVSYAESICIPHNNRAEFESLLQKALHVNPDLQTEWRLENLVMQRRARWLLSRIDELFVSKPSSPK